MKIALGADYYAGLTMKGILHQYLQEKGYTVVDCGARPDQPVDYPQIAVAVAKAVRSGECEKGILICGTGIGIGIAANKIPGIIAAHCTDTYSARMAAEHNNANIITLGERITGIEIAKEIVETWLNSEFIGGPHQACLEQIIEKEIVFPLENLGIPREEIKERLERALRLVHLEQYRNRHPYYLSGGQRQRVVLATALAMNPDILILDEATSEIDPLGAEEIMAVARELNEMGKTIIMIEHNMEEMALHADRIIVLEDGVKLAEGPAKQILADKEMTAKLDLYPPEVTQLALALLKKGIELDDIPVELTEAEAKVSDLAHYIGYVFQNPEHQIFAETVEEEVAFGPKNLGFPPEKIKAMVDRSLECLGLAHHRETPPFMLGRGEKQRLAVASILSMDPKVLIIDEPTTGLDWRECVQVMELVKELNERGHTIIMTTHNMSIVSLYAKRVVVLRLGEKILDGPTEEVFRETEMLKTAFIKAPQIFRLMSKFPEIKLENYDVNHVAEAIYNHIKGGN